MQNPESIVVSGIRATGRLHIGNYLGAIRNFFPLQQDNQCYFFVADYHTLSSSPSPIELRQHRLPIVKTFLATGIDPEKSAIYFQSAVPSVTELTLLLSIFISLSELERGTTYKDKLQKSSGNKDGINLLLFSYPVLMAADILIHKGTFVPVGQDQLQHLEMARDIARAFNRNYGTNQFPEPKSLVHQAIRLPGLDGNKMGKSDHNTIDLLDGVEAVQAKIKKGKTDPKRLHLGDSGDPEKCASIYPLHKLITPHAEIEEIAAGCKSGQLKCSECKMRLAHQVTLFLEPVQERYAKIQDDVVKDVLADGAAKAGRSAAKTVSEVRTIMGID